MERVDALGGAMASTARAAEVLSSGLERLAGIFHCTGAKLQEVLPDFLLSSELDEDAAGVAELLLAWREVGEVGVVFATRMLGLSADLRKAALQVDYERSQRLAEVARLRQSLADVSAAAAEREAELGAAARRGTWRLLGWLSRGQQPATAEELEEVEKAEQRKIAEHRATTDACLEHIAQQMAAVHLRAREALCSAVQEARQHARPVGDKMGSLRSCWRGRPSAGGGAAGHPRLEAGSEQEVFSQDTELTRGVAVTPLTALTSTFGGGYPTGTSSSEEEPHLHDAAPARGGPQARPRTKPLAPVAEGGAERAAARARGGGREGPAGPGPPGPGAAAAAAADGQGAPARAPAGLGLEGAEPAAAGAADAEHAAAGGGDGPPDSTADSAPALAAKATEEASSETSEVFTIFLAKRRADDVLGVDVSIENMALKVREVKDIGMVMKWNTDNPAKCVRIGDSLVAVNGVHGNTAAIFDQLRKPISTLEIAVQRKRVLEEGSPARSAPAGGDAPVCCPEVASAPESVDRPSGTHVAGPGARSPGVAAGQEPEDLGSPASPSCESEAAAAEAAGGVAALRAALSAEASAEAAAAEAAGGVASVRAELAEVAEADATGGARAAPPAFAAAGDCTEEDGPPAAALAQGGGPASEAEAPPREAEGAAHGELEAPPPEPEAALEEAAGPEDSGPAASPAEGSPLAPASALGEPTPAAEPAAGA